MYRGDDKRIRTQNGMAYAEASAEPGRGESRDAEGGSAGEAERSPSPSDAPDESPAKAGSGGSDGGPETVDLSPKELDDLLDTVAAEARARARVERLVELPCGHSSLDLSHPKTVSIIAEAGAVEKTCSTCDGTWVYDPTEGRWVEDWASSCPRVACTYNIQ